MARHQVLLVVGLLCTIIFGGAIFVWFKAQSEGVLKGKKKKVTHEAWRLLFPDHLLALGRYVHRTGLQFDLLS